MILETGNWFKLGFQIYLKFRRRKNRRIFEIYNTEKDE